MIPIGIFDILFGKVARIGNYHNASEHAHNLGRYELIIRFSSEKFFREGRTVYISFLYSKLFLNKVDFGTENIKG